MVLKKAGRLTWIMVWQLFASLMILLAALAILLQVLVPLLPANKNYIAGRLSEASGAEVTIGEMAAYWSHLRPSLLLENVNVVATNVSMELGHLSLQLDLPESLLARTPVFNRLEFGDIKIHITETGHASTEKTGKRELKPGGIFNFIFSSHSIHLAGLEAIYQPAAGADFRVQMEQLSIENLGEQHRVQGEVLLGEERERILLRADYTGPADRPFAGLGKVYGRIPEGALGVQSLAFFKQRLAANAEFLQINDHAFMQGEAWLTWNEGDLDFYMDGLLKGLQLEIEGEWHELALQSSVRMDANFADSYRARMAGSTLTLNQQTLQLPELDVSFTDKRELVVRSPGVDAGFVNSAVGLMPASRLQETLAVLSPSGRLTNIQASYRFPDKQKKEDSEFLLLANLEKVAVGAWKGAPAISGLDGFLRAEKTRGYVEIGSAESFSLFFPRLYEQPMVFDRASGRVSWSVDSTENQVLVGSPALSVEGASGRAHGSFYLDVPLRNSAREPFFILDIGLVDSTADDRHYFIPYVIPPTLKQWLDSSILSGQVSEAAFIYQGAFEKSDDRNKTLQTYVNVTDASLRFDPLWPQVDAINGFVIVDDSEVDAFVDRARFAELDLVDATVNVVPLPAEQGQFVTVRSPDVQGSAQSALDMLNLPVLEGAVGGAFRQWSLNGDISADVDIGVALNKSASQPGYQSVNVRLDDNSLQIDTPDLFFSDISGALRYTSDDGLFTDELSASLWGKPAVLHIGPVSQASGRVTRIDMDTRLAVDDLMQWSRLPVLGFLQGETAVKATLDIAASGNAATEEKLLAELHLQTDLKGVALELPSPFDKNPEQADALDMRVDIYPDRQRYRLALPSRKLVADLDYRVGQVLSGEVVYNEAAENAGSWSQYNAPLLVAAELESAELLDWLPVISRYEALADEYPSAHDNNSVVFALFADDFTIDGFSLGKTSGFVEQASDAWQVAFNNDWLKGRLDFYNDERLPLFSFEKINLHSELFIDAGGEQSAARDPLAGFDPRDIPLAVYDVASLAYDGKFYGGWKFSTEAVNSGIRFNDIQMMADDLALTGAGDVGGGTLFWMTNEAGEHHTQVNIQLLMHGKENRFLKSLNITPVLEAKRTRLFVDLGWDGSPLMAGMKTVSGDVSLRSVDGRFLKGNSTTDMMRVINVFNFDTWARRLKLDFSDLYSSGVSYDEITGLMVLDHGLIKLDTPLVMTSPSSTFSLKGDVDTNTNRLETELNVTLPVSNNATWVAALAGGLPAAAGAFVISKIFEKELNNLSTVSYRVSGSLDEPDIQFRHLLKSPLVGGEKREQPQPLEQPVPEASAEPSLSGGD